MNRFSLRFRVKRQRAKTMFGGIHGGCGMQSFIVPDDTTCFEKEKRAKKEFLSCRQKLLELEASGRCTVL